LNKACLSGVPVLRFENDFSIDNDLWFSGSFIVTFSNNAPDPEVDSNAVQDFLASMENAFRAHPLWAGSSEEELESAGEVNFFSSSSFQGTQVWC
jgi:Domain of unknown function (DUF5601)